MPFDDQFWRAVADYAIQFPNVGSLGVSEATWLTEYERVRRTAFASVLITGSDGDGGNASGSRNFPQETLVDALHCRRYDLDDDYELPPHLAQYPGEKVSRANASRGGFTLRFSP